MDEAQRLGVQRLTRAEGEAVVDELLVFGVEGALQDPVAAVAGVVEERVSDVVHMDADLVRASGLQHAFHEGDVAQALQHAEVGDGVLSLRFVAADAEAQPVVGIPADRGVDGPAVFGDIAPDQGPVAPFDGMVEELAGQLDLGRVSLGYDQQSGGILVDAVDQQSHPFVVVFGVGLAAQVVGQGVDQRAAVVAVAGMDHHAGRLVDDQQFVVFIDDVERDGLRLDLHATPLVRHHERDDVERADLVAGLDHDVVDADILGVDCQLHAVARCVGKMLRQILVDAYRALSAVGFQSEMLVHFLLFFLFGQQFFSFFVAHRAAILAWLVVSLRWMVVPIVAGAPGW